VKGERRNNIAIVLCLLFGTGNGGDIEKKQHNKGEIGIAEDALQTERRRLDHGKGKVKDFNQLPP